MSQDQKQSLLKELPAIGEFVNDPALADLLQQYPRSLVVQAIRGEVERLRRRILDGEVDRIDLPALFDAVRRSVQEADRPRLRRVINATGVIVHTNLGRSPLAPEAIDAVVAAARGYSNLEYDLEAGRRGQRDDLVEGLLCELTGAEAALVVNNNAAAVLLALSTLAKDREVIVSRGELIEIGGSFRIPDVLAQSGARLIEVGTTNRTHLADYEAAISEGTAVLLKVHPSNYRVVGFTAAVSGADLARLAQRHGLVSVEDLGSGSLVAAAQFGLAAEPTAAEVIAAGLDLVTFSGDKLLGGPQAGILIGRRDLIAACARHPLHRALRVDKMTLAALEATLRLYRDPATAAQRVPTLRMLAETPAQLEQKARRIARKLTKALGERVVIEIVSGASQVGGGALPLADLPGPVLAIRPAAISVTEFAARLRRLPTPIIARIEEDRLLADPRTILDDDEVLFQNGVVEALSDEAPEKK